MTNLEFIFTSSALTLIGATLVHSILISFKYRTQFHIYWTMTALAGFLSLGLECFALEYGLTELVPWAVATHAIVALMLWSSMAALLAVPLQPLSRVVAAIASLLPLAVSLAHPDPLVVSIVTACVAAPFVAFPLTWVIPRLKGDPVLRMALIICWSVTALLALWRPLAVGVFGPDSSTVVLFGGMMYVDALVILLSYYDLVRMARTVGFERLQTLLAKETDVVYSYRLVPRAGFEYLSPSILGWTGATPEEICRDITYLVRAIHPEDRNRVAEKLGAGKFTPDAPLFRFILPNGRFRYGEQRNVPVYDERGHVVGLEGVMRDVTEQVEQRQALRESEERYRTLFNAGSDMVFVTTLPYPDKPARFVAVNDAVVRVLGYEREELLDQIVTGHPLTESIGPLTPYAEVLKAGKNVMFETLAHRKDGASFPVEILLHPIVVEGVPAAIAVARDISERRDLESRLVQAQKMEAMGRLAGGVAHDFNNVLSAIIGNADLLSLRMSDTDPMRKEVDRILEAGERAARLVRQLLIFSRKQPLKRRILQLNDLVTGLVPLLQSLVGERIRLRLDLDDTLSTVKGDPVQLEQVVLNLVVNARDAMPDGGELTISTLLRVYSLESPRMPPGIDPGEYAVLTVKDTGVGIPTEMLDKVFEPFFTTKSDGTGLGLATVYGIAQRMNGAVEVESTTGKGSLFRVILPIDDSTEGGLDSAWAITSSNLPPPRGSETVLVVDDEPDVLQVAEHSLQELGYTVLAASTTEQAVTIVRDYPSPIDLLLSDVILPGLSGPELAQHLCTVRPGMKVVLMSGYSDGFVDDEQPNRVPFIPKPFSVGELGRMVRKVLDS